jgi:hypothetical protein
MTRSAAVLAFASAVLIASAAGAQTHRNLCADCHYAYGGRPDPQHLSEWESSAHARANVGCEACHGGRADMDGFSKFLQTAKNPRGGKAGSPMPAYMMQAEDADAIAAYLTSLP